MKIYLLLLIIIPFTVKSQIIEGEIKGGKGIININEPFLYGSNAFNNDHKVMVKSNNTFSYQSKSGIAGFYRIDCNGSYRYYWLASSDTLRLQINLKSKQIDIYGTASKRNSIYGKIFERFLAKNKELLRIAEPNNSVSNAELKTQNLALYRELNNWEKSFNKDVQECNGILQTLNVQNSDDSIFVEVASKATLMLYCTAYLAFSSVVKKYNPALSSKVKNMQSKLLQHYNPKDTMLFYNNPAWSIVTAQYLMNFASESPNKLQDSTWATFGSYRKYAYKLPPLAQEYFLGHSLIKMQYIGDNKDSIAKRHAIFKRKFPNSVFNNYFIKDTASLLENRKDIKVLNTSDILSISGLISKLDGKKIVVQLWASWCPSCKKEFMYADSLYRSLKQRNVELLYVSFNSKDAEMQWKSDIYKYDLKGYHIRIDQNINLGLEIKEIIYLDKSIDLPNYAFLDENGELIVKDLPRPSTGQKLLEEIDRLLKK